MTFEEQTHSERKKNERGNTANTVVPWCECKKGGSVCELLPGPGLRKCFVSHRLRVRVCVQFVRGIACKNV